MPAPRAHVENTCARGAGIHGVFSVSHTTHTTHHTPHHNPPQQHDHHTTQRRTERGRDIERRGDEREEDKRIEERREKREDPFSVWWCMAVFFVGVVICHVKPVKRPSWSQSVFELLPSAVSSSELLWFSFSPSSSFSFLLV